MVRLLLIGIAVLILMLAKKGPGYRLVISMAVTTIIIVSLGAFLVPDTPGTLEEGIGKPPPEVKNENQETLDRSNQAYVNGLKAINRKDYSTAIGFLIQVVPEDEHYQDARAALERAQRERDRQLLAEGKSKIEAGDYEAAVKIFEKILAYSPGFAEAKELKRQAEEKIRAQQIKETDKTPAIDWGAAKNRMTKWDYGPGTVGIAVDRTRVSTSVNTDFGFHYEARDNDGQYVWLLVSAINSGGISVTVSTDDFTLSTVDGNMVARNEATFSQDYFKTVNLSPGKTTSGWIIFFMPKNNRYLLRYHGPGGPVEKGIVL